MKKNLIKILLLIFSLFSFYLFADVVNEVVANNTMKKVEKIEANKNRDFSSLNIRVNKLNAKKIDPIKTQGNYVFFDIKRESENYTYFVTDREEQIPHLISVNGVEVKNDINFSENSTRKIGHNYEVVNSNDKTDTLMVETTNFKTKNIYISVFDKDKNDVVNLYTYERRIRRPRSYLDVPNFGTIYLGAVNPGFSLYRKYPVAQELWWFYQAQGGRKWNSIPVTNMDNLQVTPLNRKFLERFFLGASYDFIGKATYLNMNEMDNPSNNPVKVTNESTDIQNPVTIKTNNQTFQILRENIQEHYLENGTYPAWKASGIIRTPILRSFFRHGVYEATNIWYSIYGQLEYRDEDNVYVAGMYEIDNTNGKEFFVQIGADLQIKETPPKNPLFEKIQFLLQRGTFQSEATVNKKELSQINGGRLVKFTSFQGNLKEVLNRENTSGTPKNTLFYAEYGGNYTTEIRQNSTIKGISVNRTESSETSGIVIPESLGTGRYTIDLRYKNIYGDYLQYGPNYSKNDNYDTFVINYLDNREDGQATVNLDGFAVNTSYIFAKDGNGNLDAKEGAENNGKKLRLDLKNGTQIPNTVHKNLVDEDAKQRVSRLKITRQSDNQTFESTFYTYGLKTLVLADDVGFGFDRNGDFIIHKKAVSTGQDVYTVEPFDTNGLPLGKITVTVIKDAVKNVGDIEYDIDKLLFTSNLEGWLKLDGSFASTVGSGSNKVIPKMLRSTKSVDYNNILKNINIKDIVSVSEFGNDGNLISNKRRLKTENGLEVYAKDYLSSEEFIAIKKGAATLSDFFELKIKGAFDSRDKKTYKVIYKDNNDEFKSFNVILTVKNNAYHTLKYDVNMSNFPLDKAFDFNLTTDSFERDWAVSSNTNSSMKIRKSIGEIDGLNGNTLGLGTAFSKLALNDLTLKIDKISTNGEKINYPKDKYILNVSKKINSGNITGLDLNITKLEKLIPEEKVKLVYLYKNIVPLGEVEFAVNSAAEKFLYGEGLLDLNEFFYLLEDPSNLATDGNFWYIKLQAHTSNNSNRIPLSGKEFFISNGRGKFISHFRNQPWSNPNGWTPPETKIEIMTGDFYNFAKNGRIDTSKIDKITVEKDNLEIDKFDLSSSGRKFDVGGSNPAPEYVKNHSSDNILFGVDNDGGLLIGGIFRRQPSGVYKLNFYKNGTKNGEFILNVFDSRKVARPQPTTKSRDTLIVEIDKRVKQLFNNNNQIMIKNISSTPTIISGSFNKQMQEFVEIKTLVGDKMDLLNFLSSSTTRFFKETSENPKSGNMYQNKNSKNVVNLGNFDLHLYKEEFDDTDEVTRSLYYQDTNANTEKSIKIVIRFVGDDKKTIIKTEDVTNLNLGSKQSSTLTSNVKDLLMFNSGNYSSSNVTNSIKERTTPREYVGVNSNISGENITYEIFRYAKVFLDEKRVYTIKYKDIEMQDIEFNILNKGTDGEASINLTNNWVTRWGNFILDGRSNRIINNSLKAANSGFMLTDIKGELIDARIFSSDGIIQSNARRLKVTVEGENRELRANVNGSFKLQTTEIPGIKIGVEAGEVGKPDAITGFLFIDKTANVYESKVIYMTVTDENDNLISTFKLNMTIDDPNNVGKITLKISDRLYKYMESKKDQLFWITQDGDIASTLSDLNNDSSKENYKNFMSIENNARDFVRSIASSRNIRLNSNSSISWRANNTVDDRTKLNGDKYSKKSSLSEEGLELPSITTFADLKNGTKFPKIYLELDGSGRQLDKFYFVSEGHVYSIDYEIIKDNDTYENISGSINTFSIPENTLATFTSTNKTQHGATFDIADFMNVKSSYREREPYKTSDYSFVKHPISESSNKVTGDGEKAFNIYKIKMTYGNNKNGIGITKTKNTYTEPFQEMFDIYYKNVKLGTYNLTFENIPEPNSGSAKLDLSDFGTSSSTTWKINGDGTLSKNRSADNPYELTNFQGKFPYANLDANSKLEIKVRKKGEAANTAQTLSNSNFTYTDRLNGEDVLRLEFSSLNNNPTLKVSKLSEKNDPKSNSATYEITYTYLNNGIRKNLGTFDLTVVRNEKDLGKLVLKASPYKIVNPLVDGENGAKVVVNNGTFENKWKEMDFPKKSETTNIKVQEWLKVNEVAKNNGKFEFSDISTNEGSKKESLSIQTNNSKTLDTLIKEAKHEYMLPTKDKPVTFSFVDQNGKYYKLAVEYQYEVVEKQTAAASLVLTELNKDTYEFIFKKNSKDKELKAEGNKKDEKDQDVKLTGVTGFLDVSKFSGSDYKMTITKGDKKISDGIKNYKYTSENYDIELSGSKIIVTKKKDGAFDDTLNIKIEAFDSDNSIPVLELTLKLKSESKFEIKGNKILNFGIISYSPFDTVNLARGVETFEVTGAKNKTLHFEPRSKTATMTHTSLSDKTINVRDIEISKIEKHSTNNDIYFFTMQAFAETKPDMSPGKYSGEIDVIITIMP